MHARTPARPPAGFAFQPLRMSATMPRPSFTASPAATAASTPQSLGPLPPLEGFDPKAGSQPALGANNKGGVWVPQMARPRRNRKSETVRGMVRENIVLPRNFIYPLFIHDEVRGVACVGRVRWVCGSGSGPCVRWFVCIMCYLC